MNDKTVAPQQHDISYVLRICAVAALGGLLFGYDTAVISGAVEALQQYFSLSPAETGWAVSNVVVGCIVGALGAAGSPAAWDARRPWYCRRSSSPSPPSAPRWWTASSGS